LKFKIDRRLATAIGVNTAIVAALVAVNWTVLAQYTTLASVINIFAALLLVAPMLVILYLKYEKKKELENMFPVFLRDFVESVRGGMAIPQAIKTVSRNDYKALSPYVRKIAAQMDWGIPVSTVLLRFSKEVKSRVIGRIISSVVESHRFGGNLIDAFEALSKTAVEVERLRAERMLYLQSQMMTGYIIFFVFLGVMLGLQQFLVPSLAQVSPLGVLSGASQEGLAAEYKAIFRNLIIIQGLFAGLTVGKMAEGSIVAGVKHSVFMVFAGSLIFSIFG
jgi:flagellar protein FlaJ